MQAIEHDNTRRLPEMFREERMNELLEDDEVKEVRVFNLKKGMKIEVGGSNYKVTTCRSNGKITIRRMS